MTDPADSSSRAERHSRAGAAARAVFRLADARAELRLAHNAARKARLRVEAAQAKAAERDREVARLRQEVERLKEQTTFKITPYRGAAGPTKNAGGQPPGGKN